MWFVGCGRGQKCKDKGFFVVRMDQLHSLGQFCLSMFGGFVFNTVYSSIKTSCSFLLDPSQFDFCHFVPHASLQKGGERQ